MLSSKIMNCNFCIHCGPGGQPTFTEEENIENAETLCHVCVQSNNSVSNSVSFTYG